MNLEGVGSPGTGLDSPAIGIMQMNNLHDTLLYPTSSQSSQPAATGAPSALAGADRDASLINVSLREEATEEQRI